MENNPFVSVILPTYNGKKEWLSESVDSVLAQTFKDFELIIINDASTNDIEGTILKYKNQDSRIVYLKNEKKLNLTNTLNKGIKHAKGRYIARIDDDDIWISKDKLEKQVKFMEDNSEYGLCGAGYICFINENGEKIKEVKEVSEDDEIRSIMMIYLPFIHSGVIIRKSVLDEVGSYNPKYNKAEDYELWLRIGLKFKLKNLKNVIICYRINRNGIYMNSRYYRCLLWIKVCIKYRKGYPNLLNGIIYKVLPESLIIFLINAKKKMKKFIGKI